MIVRLTMLPISVEPRAKMKVICLQAPSSSLAVEPVPPRPNCLRSRTAVGMAAAVPARMAATVVAENFMVAVGGRDVDVVGRLVVVVVL